MNINRNTSHPSAFISSTFLDLRGERKAVARVLKESNLNVNALDIQPASNNKSKDEILKGINESDFIILIVGQRYGSVIPEMTGSEKHSITKWEYLQAKLKMRKDILVFFKEPNGESQAGHEAQSDTHLKLLDEFKNQLSKNHNPKYFSTVQELEHEVKQALIPIYRTGVTSLLSELDQLKGENAQLKQENEILKWASARPDFNGIQNPKVKGLLGLPDTTSNAPMGLLGRAFNGRA
jgi:hypothetical protein